MLHVQVAQVSREQKANVLNILKPNVCLNLENYIVVQK